MAKRRGWALIWRSHLYISRIYTRTNLRIIKDGGWALTRRWALIWRWTLTWENTVALAAYQPHTQMNRACSWTDIWLHDTRVHTKLTIHRWTDCVVELTSHDTRLHTVGYCTNAECHSVPLCSVCVCVGWRGRGSASTTIQPALRSQS